MSLYDYFRRRAFRRARADIREYNRARFLWLYESHVFQCEDYLISNHSAGYWVVWHCSPRAGHVRTISEWRTLAAAQQSVCKLLVRQWREHFFKEIHTTRPR